MSKARVVVLQVIAKQLTITQAAARHSVSRRQVHRWLTRYQTGGLDALDPQSRRTKSNPNATSDEVRDRIIELRRQLTAAGHDAGPVTIAWHLDKDGH